VDFTLYVIGVDNLGLHFWQDNADL